MPARKRTTIKQLLSEMSDADLAVESIDLLMLSDIPADEWAAFKAGWPAVPRERRLAVMTQLGDIADENFTVDFSPVAKLALADEDGDVRAAAVRNLWDGDDLSLLGPLVGFLQTDASEAVRAAAASALGHFVYLGELEEIPAAKARQVEEALLAVIRGGDAGEVRRRAIEAIAYSGRAEIAPIIQTAYDDADEKMRVSAIFAMGRSLDGGRWGNFVLRELHNVAPAIRFEAARAAGELELSEAIPALAELVGDPDDEIQEAALWSLGQIGGEDARQVLNRRRRGARGERLELIEAALEEADFADFKNDLFASGLDDWDEDEEARA